MTVPVPDFPDMVAGPEVEAALTWDFRLASGITLTGTPTVTVTVYEHSEGADATPQARLVSTVVGTASGGVTNCSVLAKFGPCPVSTAGDVRYLFTVSCANTAGGVSACFNKILCMAPG